MIESENVVLIPKGNIGEANSHEEKLDEQSGINYIYITSVYHDDVKELKLKLKAIL